MAATRGAAHPSARAWAAAQVDSVRDAPADRFALLEATYRSPPVGVRRHLPYRRAALSFMRWQERRGLLNPLGDAQPGSPWWREVNARMLHDGCEAVALADGRPGEPSAHSVELWCAFVAEPTAERWYRAHNASIVGAYLAHRSLADAENDAERFFMNVVLMRVLYAHALVGNGRFALGRFALLGGALGDPRLGMAGVFLSLGRVLPNRYPLVSQDIAAYVAREHQFGRALDFAVIAPRAQALYEWSAVELREPRLLELIDRGTPTYGWPYEQHDVWHTTRLPRAARLLGAALHPR